MIFAFTLSMPNNNSWNGRWSGEDNLYCIVKSYRSKKAIDKALGLQGNHYYNFGDGWGANVNVAIVDDQNTARTLRRKSKGFCGYDWMVDSLEMCGVIKAPN